MKRICTEEEKELLLRNKKQALTGFYWTSGNSSWIGKIILTVVSIMAAVGITIPVALYFEFSEFVVYIGIFLVYIIIYRILWTIFNSIRTKKQAKAFLKQKNLSVNGATMIEVYYDGSFAYIEDDVKDESGKPIILVYSYGFYEVKEEEAGKRLLVMYDDEGEYQLMRLNDDLKGMIPDRSEDYPLQYPQEECIRVFHPNMLRMEKEEHIFTEEEKKRYADWYIKTVRGANIKAGKAIYVVLVCLTIVFCILLNFMEDGVTFSKSVPVAGLSLIGIAVFYALLSQIGKINFKRQAQFISKQDVVFQAYEIKNNTAMVTVYEWVDGKPELREYFAGNVSTKTKYGAMIYKFKDKKGKPVLLNAETVKM